MQLFLTILKGGGFFEFSVLAEEMAGFGSEVQAVEQMTTSMGPSPDLLRTVLLTAALARSGRPFFLIHHTLAGWHFRQQRGERLRIAFMQIK
jgi:hypothetical protein